MTDTTTMEDPPMAAWEDLGNAPPPPMSQQFNEFIVSFSDMYMFPSPYHIFLNRIWLIQTLACLAYLISKKRWVPLPPSKRTSPWPVRQMKWMLIIQIIFYTIELMVTGMTVKFQPMAAHHLDAIVLFIFILWEFNIIAVPTMMPFLAHTIYWSLGAVDDNLLAVYNWVFFFVGLWALDISARLGNSILSPRIGILCVAEIAINYFTYCTVFHGEYCLHHLGIFKNIHIEWFVENMILFSMAGSLVYFYGLWMRRRHGDDLSKIWRWWWGALPDGVYGYKAIPNRPGLGMDMV